MLAMVMSQAVVWKPVLVALSAVIAAAASAVALLIFFWLRKVNGWHAIGWQVAAATVMGVAISGMHYTGMAAASFPAGTFCLSIAGLRGESLGMLVLLVSVVLMTMTMFTSALDSRMQSQTAQLASSLQVANEALKHAAFRDPLTGLCNRVVLEDRLERAVARCGRRDTGLALLFVDLDAFKPINDSFGHSAGDAVLKEIGARLKTVSRNIDTVARIGGDEFVVLIEEAISTDAATKVAQRILQALRTPFRIEDHDVQLSCSIGIACYPEHGPAARLVARADAAMYTAKRAGGSTCVVWTPAMEVDVRGQVGMQGELRLALERNELALHYQPKVDARTGRVTGAEALVRWHHPDKGTVSPAEFIPLAERFGLIGALGQWVIDDACRQMRAWLDGGTSIAVAVNLSVHQLRRDDLVPRVRHALEQHRIDPKLLTFEITESAAMEDTHNTMQVFSVLAQLGVSLSIDDFGTGYSSLAYLRKLPATQIKIDRSFVSDLGQGEDALAVVNAVVSLAHALGLEVVAEGVETEQQRDILVRLQCEQLQGFLFAKPMPAAEFLQWVRHQYQPARGNVPPLTLVQPRRALFH
jgi:diguanylate cyclase (GGDEF)-like protein